MTEQEAKKKWCPMVRFHVAQDRVWSNKLGGGAVTENTDKCIGIDCMMWRNLQSMPMMDMYEGVKIREYSVPAGYCGLAGKP